MEADSPSKSLQLETHLLDEICDQVPRFGMQGMQDSLRRLVVLGIPETSMMV